MGWQLPLDWNVYGPWSSIGSAVEKQPSCVSSRILGSVLGVSICCLFTTRSGSMATGLGAASANDIRQKSHDAAMATLPYDENMVM